MSEQTIDLIFNTVGIIGVCLIVLGFFLIQTGKITSTDMIYPTLNFVGATMHLISLYRFYNLPSVVIELFWIGISVYGIIKIKKTAKL